MTCGIYKIENKINGKVYIGQSVNIKKRWKEHKYLSNNISLTQVLYKAIRKYGLENFEFDIICECNKNDLNDLEIKYIKEFNSYIKWENNNGYNMTAGGEGIKGYKLSKKMKEHLRIINTGKKHSDETKLKIRNILINNNVNCKKVVCNEIVFKSIKECAIYFNDKPTNIYAYLQKSVMPKNYYDLKLRYFNDEFNGEIQSIKTGLNHHNTKKIIIDDKLFNTIEDCSIYCNINKKTLKGYLNKQDPIPFYLYKRGLRYLNEAINNNIQFKYKMIHCDGLIFRTMKQCAIYYNITYSTFKNYFHNKTPQKYIDLGLRYATEEDLNTYPIYTEQLIYNTEEKE